MRLSGTVCLVMQGRKRESKVKSGFCLCQRNNFGGLWPKNEISRPGCKYKLLVGLAVYQLVNSLEFL